jgi:hypothetical protein
LFAKAYSTLRLRSHFSWEDAMKDEKHRIENRIFLLLISTKITVIEAVVQRILINGKGKAIYTTAIDSKP